MSRQNLIKFNQKFSPILPLKVAGSAAYWQDSRKYASYFLIPAVICIKVQQ
jgi:hypothetical protein